MAGQPEKAFAEGGRMEGAIREEFPGVKMGKMSADGKAFKGTNPNILEITFTGPVSHGPLFSATLSKLVKRQLGENIDNTELYTPRSTWRTTRAAPSRPTSTTSTGSYAGAPTSQRRRRRSRSSRSSTLLRTPRRWQGVAGLVLGLPAWEGRGSSELPPVMSTRMHPYQRQYPIPCSSS